MTINIYKQRKIAGKADQGMRGGRRALEMTGARSRSGINLRVIKKEGEIISDKLMELHHALGQRAPSPKRNNKGRARGTPISGAVGPLRIQRCQVLS